MTQEDIWKIGSVEKSVNRYIKSTYFSSIIRIHLILICMELINLLYLLFGFLFFPDLLFYLLWFYIH